MILGGIFVINMAKHIRISLALRRMLALVLAVNVAIASMLIFIIDAAALMADPSTINTMTGYASLNDYQHALWDDIVDQTFVWDENDDSAVNPSKGTSRNPSQYSSKAVRENNPYFNWKTGVAEAEGGSTTSVGKETITYESDSVQSGADPTQTINAAQTTVTYNVYNVATAKQLRAAMLQAAAQSSGTATKINLLNDINLNGAEETWTNLTINYGTLYIEGNGYTIYNMKVFKNSMYAGFIGHLNSGVKLVIKILILQIVLPLQMAVLAY